MNIWVGNLILLMDTKNEIAREITYRFCETQIGKRVC